MMDGLTVARWVLLLSDTNKAYLKSSCDPIRAHPGTTPNKIGSRMAKCTDTVQSKNGKWTERKEGIEATARGQKRKGEILVNMILISNVVVAMKSDCC